jgi:hypothetical protein
LTIFSFGLLTSLFDSKVIVIAELFGGLEIPNVDNLIIGAYKRV